MSWILLVFISTGGVHPTSGMTTLSFPSKEMCMEAKSSVESELGRWKDSSVLSCVRGFLE